MAITAKQVKELRDRTGVGMMDAKKALQEVDGDMDKAIDYLRETGQAKAAKKAGRIAAEGLAKVLVKGNDAVIVELNAETDFVAKNEKFQNMLNAIAEALLEAKPSSLEDAMTSVQVDGTQLDEYMSQMISVIGENLNLRRFTIFSKTDGQHFGQYSHLGGKIAVLVTVDGGDEEVASNVAMHIGGINPQYIDENSVPEEVVEHEREVLTEQSLNEGKPEKIVHKMVEGRLRKFFSEICLVDQDYLLDGDQTVGQYLSSKAASVVDFRRYEVGEGIEKQEEDFAAEVQSQMGK
ncbi:translation elongation factor Ts [Aerococcus sanguinicola]|uniref:translation elongation factor Ts n=1 Tax=unclassified Aerococcus TaxID=2618060 RepID=UPI0008A5DEEF|nr:MULTISPECIES: translation elongation factor Ts [unclassified Aerococcus]MDK6232720.1 translation elongation factor Ts [Aerococcus sp. UMB10185]MDK6854990.1 translation elongation factor Ts [Aerococcus sp. UMB7533]MDK8501744.1 translation elongation factor Ts [Aerococcus sp. UMB1112A]OFN02748.1 elongation factor Ts [Aerococcus sp. HMSC062A02]OHO45583.1 elongation factor Ts [Aerococcus sp. HMSC035B07]